MSFFIGLSKSPAAPVVSRNTPATLILSPAPFLSFVPVQNLIPSSLKGLISPLLLVLFPRHPLKRARTAPNGSDGRSRGGWYPESMELIYPRNQSLHACALVSTVTARCAPPGKMKRKKKERSGTSGGSMYEIAKGRRTRETGNRGIKELNRGNRLWCRAGWRSRSFEVSPLLRSGYRSWYASLNETKIRPRLHFSSP